MKYKNFKKAMEKQRKSMRFMCLFIACLIILGIPSYASTTTETNALPDLASSVGLGGGQMTGEKIVANIDFTLNNFTIGELAGTMNSAWILNGTSPYGVLDVCSVSGHKMLCDYDMKQGNSYFMAVGWNSSQNLAYKSVTAGSRYNFTAGNITGNIYCNPSCAEANDQLNDVQNWTLTYSTADTTTIQLWINNAQANLTTSCSVESTNNYTAKINTTGLPVSILYNGTHAITNTTTANWYASLIAGYWNITANYSGNASYLKSSTTLFHNITKGTTNNISISFNTSPTTNNTTCINVPVFINASAYLLEDDVKLYNDTAEIGKEYTFISNVSGTWNFTANSTTGDCYLASSTTRSLVVDNCTIKPANITTLCYYIPQNIISYKSCSSDNKTLMQNWTMGNESCIAYANCSFGCDNILHDCKPAPYMINIFILALLIVFVLAMYKIYRWL